MTNKRIDKAIEIIEYAIKHDISVGEASIKYGYAYSYVKNVKITVEDSFENGDMSEEDYKRFSKTYKRYQNNESRENQTFEKINNMYAKPNKPEIVSKTANKPTDLPNSSGEKINVNIKDSEAEIEWVSGSNYPKNHVKTLKQLLTESEVDLDIWKVRDYVINKWDTTSWKNKNPETIQNWQVKARLERDVEIEDIKDIEKIFAEMANKYQPPVLDWTPINSKHLIDEHNLLEISIFDLHLGKLCWGGETGEDYDVKIASKRFMDAIETLLHRASSFNYDRILFPVGNDFFNSDTILNTTTAGTPQSEDLRWQKTFNVGVKLLVDGINMLKQTGVPVDVIVIAGNHDFERSHYMGKYLEAWFNNDPQVHINCGASPRKYYRFGEVLLGFTHGDEEKESSLPMIMANDIESKPMWSETKFHEFHVGHIHRKKNVTYTVLDKSKTLAEDLGVTVRYLSSLSGTDSWHHRKGFIGQIKAADAFIWNYESGLIAHLVSNLNIE